MDKAETYATLLAGAAAVITTLAGLAYSNVLDRIKRGEDQRERDLEAVWSAIDEQRKDTKEILTSMVTKEDLNRSTDQLIKALSPAR